MTTTEMEPLTAEWAPPAPQTVAEMAEYFERIRALEAKIEQIDAYEAERIARIKVACDTDRKAHEAQIALWAGSILAFLEQLGEERVRLPDLGVSIAAKDEKGLKWTDEAKLAAWAKEHDLLHPPKPPEDKPDKKAIQAHFKATGEVPDGAEVKSGKVLDIAKLRGGAK